MATIPSNDDFSTRAMVLSEESEVSANNLRQPESLERVRPPFTPIPDPVVGTLGVAIHSDIPAEPEPVAIAPAVSMEKAIAAVSPLSEKADINVTFNRFASLAQPPLPDIGALMAALSTLDGQVMALQEQFNNTLDAQRKHDAEVAETANQLRVGIHRVADRMDSTIADVARSREALAWAELLQLMEDVMNNPRDIEYVTKLARKARELNKVFQLHQNVLNTMAECNSLLRSMIGDDKY